MYDYVHLPQGEAIGPDGRAYVATEAILEYNGRQILILDVEATEISFCDGSFASRLNSIIVKGYIVDWKYTDNDHCTPVSLIESIESANERDEIARIVQARYNISQINFAGL